MVTPFHHTVQLGLLVAGAAVLLSAMLHRHRATSRAGRAHLALLAVVVTLSLFGYVRFGSFHNYGAYGVHGYHVPDLYHYRVGAAYYGELGYDGIYEATLLALDDLAAEGRTVPEIHHVRDLRDQLTPVTADEVRARGDAVRARFRPERWESFKADIGAVLQTGYHDQGWRNMLMDMGFNPPPSWAIVAAPVAWMLPWSIGTMDFYGLIDLTLLVLVGGILVHRAFGPWALAAFLLAFSNNWVASHDWIGGSFFRMTWCAALVAAICALRGKRFGLAGALFGISIAFRVFPVVFMAGAWLSLAAVLVRSRSNARPVIALTAGAVATVATLVLASLAMWGTDPWATFIARIWGHNKTFFAMHIGLDKLVVAPVFHPGPDGWAGDYFTVWHDRILAYYQANRAWAQLSKVALLALAVAAAVRLTPARAAMILGGTALFLFAMPANYYYVYLALFPVVLWQERARATDVLRFALAFAVLIAFFLAPLRWTELLQYNIAINAAMLGFLTGLLSTYFVDWVWSRRREPA